MRQPNSLLFILFVSISIIKIVIWTIAFHLTLYFCVTYVLFIFFLVCWYIMWGYNTVEASNSAYQFMESAALAFSLFLLQSPLLFKSSELGYKLHASMLESKSKWNMFFTQITLSFTLRCVCLQLQFAIIVWYFRNYSN